MRLTHPPLSVLRAKQKGIIAGSIVGGAAGITAVGVGGHQLYKYLQRKKPNKGTAKLGLREPTQPEVDVKREAEEQREARQRAQARKDLEEENRIRGSGGVAPSELKGDAGQLVSDMVDHIR